MSISISSISSMLEAKKQQITSPSSMFDSIYQQKIGTANTESSAYQSSQTSSSYDIDSLLQQEQLNNMINSLSCQHNDSSTVKTDYDDIISKASSTYGISESLIKAVIECESSFNPNAVSSSGAVGLMQLMPATAKSLGVSNSYDPEDNIMGGTKYLSSLVKNFDGDLVLALSGYNMGGNKTKNLGITPNTTNSDDYNKIPSGVLSYANKVISKMSKYGG